VRQQYGARIGTPPQNRLTTRVPGEDAAPVRFEEPGRGEVPACRKQPVRFAQRLIHGRERLGRVVFGQPNDRAFHSESRVSQVAASRRKGTCARASSMYLSTASSSLQR